eukprot:scaffold627_cov55-Attheya_sp.AAC.3
MDTLDNKSAERHKRRQRLEEQIANMESLASTRSESVYQEQTLDPQVFLGVVEKTTRRKKGEGSVVSGGASVASSSSGSKDGKDNTGGASTSSINYKTHIAADDTTAAMASTNKAREIMASLDEPDEVPSVVDPTASDHPAGTSTDPNANPNPNANANAASGGIFSVLRDKLGVGDHKDAGSQHSGLDWSIPTAADHHYFYGEDPDNKKTTSGRKPWNQLRGDLDIRDSSKKAGGDTRSFLWSDNLWGDTHDQDPGLYDLDAPKGSSGPGSKVSQLCVSGYNKGLSFCDMFCKTSERRLKLIALIGGLLTILIILTAHPSSPIRKDNDTRDPGPAPIPTITGTGTGTKNPKTNNSGKNLLELRDFVLKNTITTEKDLLIESSPQSKALKWLFVTDVMQDKVEQMNRDTLIRYALGTLYYSTNNVPSTTQDGKSREDIWKTETDWLSPNSVCGWFGITCGGARDDDSEVVGIALSDNGLGGTLPKELATLTELKSLVMHDNDMDGPIPSEYGQLTQMRNLHLSNNPLTGTLSPNLFGVKNALLVEVYLEHCKLTGSLPSELGNLSNLRTYLGFSLFQNMMTGTIPTTVGNMVALEALYLDENFLKGTIPSQLGALPHLQDLRLRDNELTGPIPPELVNAPLDALYLDSNNLSGSIPEAIFRSPSLTQLHLYSNALEGRLPTNMGALTNLGTLRASRLAYNLFDWCGMIALLEQHHLLYLDNNKLTGPIPTSLGKLKRLESIYLLDNLLTGPLPVELFDLDNLKDLQLSHNKLTGRIPKEIGRMTQLVTCYLDNNEMGGPIPDEMKDLRSIKQLRIHGNRLTGAVPADVCLLELVTELTSDCLAPGMECTCCTKCY